MECTGRFNYINYLSHEIPLSVKTLAATVTFAIKLFTVQYHFPNFQSLQTNKTKHSNKKKMQFSNINFNMFLLHIRIYILCLLRKFYLFIVRFLYTYLHLLCIRSRINKKEKFHVCETLTIRIMVIHLLFLINICGKSVI